jgi:WD40 repeat protein
VIKKKVGRYRVRIISGYSPEVLLTCVVLAPSTPTTIGLPTSANLLQSSLEHLHVGGGSGQAQPLLLASTADRRLNVIFPDTKNLVRSHTQLQDSPILSYTVVQQRYLICSSMSGKVVVYDSRKDELVAHRKDHAKYVVHVASYESGDHVWLATAGWDQKVWLYRCRTTEDGITFEDPVGTIQLPSNPEALLFRREPDGNILYLLVTRRDSTFIYYYEIAENVLLSSASKPVIVPISGKQNLAPLYVRASQSTI